MLTPEGKPANKMDKVMLLSQWAKFVARVQEKKGTGRPMIYAGMGKPTYPLPKDIRDFLIEYWKKHNGDAIDYGDPQGDPEARELMAKAMTQWYGFKVNAHDVLFTVGGAGALHSIFSALKNNVKTANFRVITPFPYYTLYAENNLHLHPIYVMENNGYRLTAESLLKSIRSAEELAKKDSGYPRAVLLCDPNNPLGSVIGENELKKIAHVLRQYPDLVIVLDEAYAEMVLDGTKHVSLLTVAPDLKERIIVMRSATKGLSAAGERMAITLAFNSLIMNTILEHSILNYGHAPRSLQMAYAKTMANFTDANRISINNFYRQKVDYASRRLLEMGVAMPDKDYQVKGTFYILADFSELLGEHLPQETAAALEKEGKITTDEDIAYMLLFTDSVMVSPASYYGVEKYKGYLRITCSAELDKLENLMDRLEEHLKQNRLKKQERLKNNIATQLLLLEKLSPKAASQLPKLTSIINLDTKTALKLKNENKALEEYLQLIKRLINRETPEGKIRAITLIQSAYRGHRARTAAKEIIRKQDNEWFNFVAKVSPQANNGVGAYLKQLTIAERLGFEPWKEHLKEKDRPQSANFFMNAMHYSMLKPYIALIVFIGLASGIVACLGLATTSVIALTATSIVTAATLATGLSFFSQSVKRHFSPDCSKEGEEDLQLDRALCS
ncbi:aminotransferase class I/II-fold pyridoxal phosphate-dependent enzyme [Legionella sp. km772]|uniref:aminotransferase class I/II-fold pyridoxal phosphate-dependent enzyme n=1 Tax=Legionella sp. km772 TaxID=2498111 RepID=UPI000F8E4B66|nr:aminotransferase class I/II-fold pyridoxal phosphate-dependent enzyme [Legionella sp. km772]RUR10264.1 aminotransferase class I/II-fold pyridoxal phosphate-dependent enzyme [Legionella sp. km772]